MRHNPSREFFKEELIITNDVCYEYAECYRVPLYNPIRYGFYAQPDFNIEYVGHLIHIEKAKIDDDENLFQYTYTFINNLNEVRRIIDNRMTCFRPVSCKPSVIQRLEDSSRTLVKQNLGNYDPTIIQSTVIHQQYVGGISKRKRRSKKRKGNKVNKKRRSRKSQK